MSAYRRWELAALAAPAADTAAADAHAAAVAHATAEREGREAGYAAGLAAADAERAQLAALLAKMSTAAGDHEQRLCDEVLDLALVLARQLVGEALAVRREFILPIVSAALKQLPQSTQRVELMLNPSDVELVRIFLGDGEFAHRCQLLPDASIAPRRMASCRASADVMASGCCSQSRVLPAMSVNRKARVPVAIADAGRSTGACMRRR
jgi:flagellar assembly protein FliH